MDWEYVALTWETHDSGSDPVFGDDMRELLDERWEEVCRAPFEPKRIGGACIMRRPKDEPRMWTRVELIGLIKRLVISELDYGDPRGIPGSVLNERVMQDLCGRLERRNMEATGLQGRLSERQETIRAQTLHIAELQTAIREVVNAERYLDPDSSIARYYDEIQGAIHQFLYPLVPGEEASPTPRTIIPRTIIPRTIIPRTIIPRTIISPTLVGACKRWEKRNAELQEAIDEVVCVSKQPCIGSSLCAPGAVEMGLRTDGAVRRLLYPLATKKGGEQWETDIS